MCMPNTQRYLKSIILIIDTFQVKKNGDDMCLPNTQGHIKSIILIVDTSQVKRIRG